MTKSTDIFFRAATYDDLDAIVAMLADDPLGATRESPGSPAAACYVDAFAYMDTSLVHELIVAESAGVVCGYLELMLLRGLSRQGMLRAQIESVRIAGDRRGDGIGQQLFEYAIERARARGAAMVQLTTDKTRPDAVRFYERLGFVASHEGMKLKL